MQSKLKLFLHIIQWIPKVHAHGDGELLVVDGEDVQDLHVDVHMDGAVRFGGLELLIIERQTESKHTLEHACTITVEVIKDTLFLPFGVDKSFVCKDAPKYEIKMKSNFISKICQ